MKILRARLYERERRAQQEKLQEKHDNLDEISWGNQIRSYVMQPYRLVKDHRTNTEKGNVDAVMDGDIDEFIEAYLMNLMNTREKARDGVVIPNCVQESAKRCFSRKWRAVLPPHPYARCAALCGAAATPRAPKILRGAGESFPRSFGGY